MEDLKYENEILMFIYANLHDFTIVLDFEEILKNHNNFFIKLENQIFVLEKAEKITDEFEFEHKDKQIFNSFFFTKYWKTFLFQVLF